MNVVTENGKVCITRRRAECVKKLEFRPCHPLQKKTAVSNFVGSCTPSQIQFFLDGITYTFTLDILKVFLYLIYSILPRLRPLISSVVHLRSEAASERLEKYF